MCLPRAGCFIFRMDDSQEDGLSGPLHGNSEYFYELVLDGQTIMSERYGTENINFGEFIELEFGECALSCGSGKMPVDWEFRTDDFG